jgi:hypothetical protein
MMVLVVVMTVMMTVMMMMMMMWLSLSHGRRDLLHEVIRMEASEKALVLVNHASVHEDKFRPRRALWILLCPFPLQKQGPRPPSGEGNAPLAPHCVV